MVWLSQYSPARTAVRRSWSMGTPADATTSPAAFSRAIELSSPDLTRAPRADSSRSREITGPNRRCECITRPVVLEMSSARLFRAARADSRNR
jgi:hypothetical protein